MSNDLDNFVAISSALTGIAASKLRPSLDTHKTAQAYLDYATEHGGSAFTELMGLSPAEVLEAVANEPDGDIAIMANCVTLMWYLGAWYFPDGLLAYKQGSSSFAPSVVISSDAYTQGWAWKVGQAHPMGYSELRYGYWSGQPSTLSDLVGGE